MAYDYSHEYLRKNKELVAKLVQVASSGEMIVYLSSDWRELKAIQATVNNVLANMARNVAGYENIRMLVRTWMAFDDEDSKRYKLSVGVPNHKPRGGPGPRVKAAANWAETMVPASTVLGQKYVHPEAFDGPEIESRFVYALVNLSPHFKEAVLNMKYESDPAAITEYFKELITGAAESGWVASCDTRSLILRRD